MKKAIVFTPIVLREIGEFAWLIYGNVLYFSKEADTCNEKQGGYMFVMFLFLLVGYCKMVLYIMIIAIVSYLGCTRMQRRRQS